MTDKNSVLEELKVEIQSLLCSEKDTISSYELKSIPITSINDLTAFLSPIFVISIPNRNVLQSGGWKHSLCQTWLPKSGRTPQEHARCGDLLLLSNRHAGQSCATSWISPHHRIGQRPEEIEKEENATVQQHLLQPIQDIQIRSGPQVYTLPSGTQSNLRHLSESLETRSHTPVYLQEIQQQQQ